MTVVLDIFNVKLRLLRFCFVRKLFYFANHAVNKIQPLLETEPNKKFPLVSTELDTHSMFRYAQLWPLKIGPSFLKKVQQPGCKAMVGLLSDGFSLEVLHSFRMNGPSLEGEKKNTASRSLILNPESQFYKKKLPGLQMKRSVKKFSIALLQ